MEFEGAPPTTHTNFTKEGRVTNWRSNCRLNNKRFENEGGGRAFEGFKGVSTG